MYLKSYPEGPHAEQARGLQLRRYDDRAWSTAESSGTIEGVELYLESHADGLHVEQAEALLGERREERAWLTAQAAGTIEAVEEYLSAYPQARFLAEAEERKDALIEDAWVKAEAADTSEAVRAFLDRHPESPRKAQAEKLLARLSEARDWQLAANGGSEELQAFLQSYPSSAHAEEARELLTRRRAAELRQQALRVQSVEAWDLVLETELTVEQSALATAYRKAAEMFRDAKAENRRSYYGVILEYDPKKSIRIKLDTPMRTPDMLVTEFSLSRTSTDGSFQQITCFFPEPLKVGDAVEVCGGDVTREFMGRQYRDFEPFYIRAKERVENW